MAGASMVIRYDFTGLENMFHPEHYYYAVIGSSATWVPANVVKAFHPDWDFEKSLYDDEDDNYYYVSIVYSPDGKYDTKSPSLRENGGSVAVLSAKQ